ncbi:MAG: hypothetical protein Q7S55_00260 [Nanoarchaeota archaeon]|nr:hypothetical protein [Nanoarchaeota archaeon]
MTKLLRRINGKICTKKSNRFYEPIELENLIHAGNELIWFNSEEGFADAIARNMALSIGQQYGVDYALVGKNNLELNKALRDIPNYVYIATFYNERKKATLTRIK